MLGCGPQFHEHHCLVVQLKLTILHKLGRDPAGSLAGADYETLIKELLLTSMDVF